MRLNGSVQSPIPQLFIPPSTSIISMLIEFSILAMLFGRPLMIHDQDAFLVALPTAEDDQYILPTSILPSNQPSKMTFYIATCQLYKILGDILRELYSPQDDYRTMKEEQWLSKVSSIMIFDKELKDWLSHLH